MRNPGSVGAFNQDRKGVALTMNTELSCVLPQFDVLQLMTGPSGIDDGRVAVFGRAAPLGCGYQPNWNPGLRDGRFTPVASSWADIGPSLRHWRPQNLGHRKLQSGRINSFNQNPGTDRRLVRRRFPGMHLPPALSDSAHRPWSYAPVAVCCPPMGSGGMVPPRQSRKPQEAEGGQGWPRSR